MRLTDPAIKVLRDALTRAKVVDSETRRVPAVTKHDHGVSAILQLARSGGAPEKLRRLELEGVRWQHLHDDGPYHVYRLTGGYDDVYPQQGA